MKAIEQAVKIYGKDMQLTVAVEEFSELIKEICKNKRGKDNRDNIIEEIADCQIMLSQIQIIFDIGADEIADKVIEKLERLEKRLAEGDENEAERLKYRPNYEPQNCRCEIKYENA